MCPVSQGKHELWTRGSNSRISWSDETPVVYTCGPDGPIGTYRKRDYDDPGDIELRNSIGVALFTAREEWN